MKTEPVSLFVSSVVVSLNLPVSQPEADFLFYENSSCLFMCLTSLCLSVYQGTCTESLCEKKMIYFFFQINKILKDLMRPSI